MCTDKKSRPPQLLLLLSVSICAPSVALFLSLAISGCERSRPGGEAVVVYTSVDDPVARPILDEFTRRTGIRVEARTDTEANKSAGLAARLEAEKPNPKCDVWWGNEVFRTIRLADAGVLAPYESPSAKDIPPLFKDPSHLWAGSALRARVIGVHVHQGHVKRMTPILQNETIEELTQPYLKGKVAIANPRAGTTSGHVAALYVLWGDEKATEFFRALRRNDVKVLGGNGDVATEVAKGTVLAGLTDNDDVDNVARGGGAIRAIVPDQSGIGTLTIPCTAALVAGAKNPEAAKKLIDYLLSPEVEKRLIDAKFAHSSVRAGNSGIKPLQVDYREVAKVLPRAANEAHAILTGRE
jgi:iron(III) transport system substrate-binding protein